LSPPSFPLSFLSEGINPHKKEENINFKNRKHKFHKLIKEKIDNPILLYMGNVLGICNHKREDIE